MSDIPAFLSDYAVIPKSNNFRDEPTSSMEELIESPDFVYIDESGREAPSFEVEKISAIEELRKKEIPENTFLLSTDVGDVYYHPEGFVDKDIFIVLFFDDPQKLYFIPKVGTKFVSVFDIEEKRCIYELFYSGIKFELEEQNKLVVIFHKYNDQS